MSKIEPSILILEDTRTMQNYIRDVLQPFEETHPILLARRLVEALQLAAANPVALFIVDVGLPDGDGIDFLCEMSILRPEARALIITAKPTEERRERARKLGVLNFLPKPLDRRTLLTAVRRLLAPDGEMAAAGGGFEGTLGGLSPLDLIQLKCLRGGSGVLEFSETHLLGRVWIEAGKVVHAECRMPGATQKGVEAFKCIITWRSGSIRDLPVMPTVERTIHEPWQELILDAEHQRHPATLAAFAAL
jgi:DNA-binding response OmpR family regulator